MDKWILAAIAIGMCLSGISARSVQADSGFSVAPAKLEVTVTEGDSSLVSVYVTSDFSGDLIVGTEGIPFRVDPGSIAVNSTDRDRRVELSIQGNPSAKGGEYPGKLTFLAYAGNNVAYGVKVDILVTQIGGGGSSEGFIDQLTGRDSVTIAISVVAALAALLVGVVIGRRSRRNVG
jgi:hypothetical protein